VPLSFVSEDLAKASEDLRFFRMDFPAERAGFALVFCGEKANIKLTTQIKNGQ